MSVLCFKGKKREKHIWETYSTVIITGCKILLLFFLTLFLDVNIDVNTNLYLNITMSLPSFCIMYSKFIVKFHFVHDSKILQAQISLSLTPTPATNDYFNY